EEGGGPGSRSERHCVAPTFRNRADRGNHSFRIGSGCPPVDHERADIGTRGGKGLVEAVGAGTVVLHRDPQVAHSLAEEGLLDLGAGLGFGDPLGHEPGRLNRSSRLGATSDDPSAGEHLMPFLAQTRSLGHLAPAGESDTGRDHDDIGPVLDECAGAGNEFRVIDVRDDGQSRRMHDRRAVPLKCGRELFGPPLCCQHDATSGQFAGQFDTRGLHDPILMLRSRLSNSAEALTHCGMLTNRDFAPWNATGMSMVGPARCLATMMSASPARSCSLSYMSSRWMSRTRSASCSIEPDSRRSEIIGRLSVRCSLPRLSWDRAMTGTSSSLARSLSERENSETSC